MDRKVPAHETMLGYRAGKVVCACRDFTYPDKRLFEFREIKNALSDDSGGFSLAPSDGEVILLGDVLAAIETSPLLRRVPGVRERFWDMFVVDAFLKNPDRNNGDWGLLMSRDARGLPCYELAPVYDQLKGTWLGTHTGSRSTAGTPSREHASKTGIRGLSGTRT